MSFESFGLPSQLLANVKKLGYAEPTPIQTRAVPLAMEGRDLMGLAQTGTGKTAAFLLPVLTRLMSRSEGAAPQDSGRGGRNRRAFRKPRALILAPTRELAEQIDEAAIDLERSTGLRSTTVYGGVNMNRQITALRNGVDVVVACPGRLLDHMGQRTIDLSAIEVLVLDEADQMFDMGFLPDIRRVLAGLPKDRQTMLFSATMPEAIRRLAAEILRDAQTVSVGHDAPAETISHAIYPVPQHLKTPLLMEMLRRFGEGSALVFTRTKYRARRVAEQLAKAGFSATALQGNLSQNRRREAMDGFRDGRYRVMVATDIAARGIDVNLVTHVVNYDMPSTPELYTHRIGRTGRAERAGEAHTFVTSEDMSMVRAIERLLREPLERRKVEGFDYGVPAPRRDAEFARPPRQPRGGRGQEHQGRRSSSRRDGASSEGHRSEGRRYESRGSEGTRSEGRTYDGRRNSRSDERRPDERRPDERRPQGAWAGSRRSGGARPEGDREGFRAEGARSERTRSERAHFDGERGESPRSGRDGDGYSGNGYGRRSGDDERRFGRAAKPPVRAGRDDRRHSRKDGSSEDHVLFAHYRYGAPRSDGADRQER